MEETLRVAIHELVELGPAGAQPGGLGVIAGLQGERGEPIEGGEGTGVEPEEMQPIIEAIGAGDMAKGIELTTPEIAERLSVAGTPEECVEKLKTQIADAGINHMILAITDASLVKALMGREIEGVPDVNTQLQLVHDKVMPAFS